PAGANRVHPRARHNRPGLREGGNRIIPRARHRPAQRRHGLRRRPLPRARGYPRAVRGTRRTRPHPRGHRAHPAPARASARVTTTQEALTPTVRTGLRKSVFWVSMASITLLIVLTLALITRGATVDGRPLSPESAAPTGAMALAEVLRSQGVQVTHATSLIEA